MDQATFSALVLMRFQIGESHGDRTMLNYGLLWVTMDTRWGQIDEFFDKLASSLLEEKIPRKKFLAEFQIPVPHNVDIPVFIKAQILDAVGFVPVGRGFWLAPWPSCRGAFFHESLSLDLLPAIVMLAAILK